VIVRLAEAGDVAAAAAVASASYRAAFAAILPAEALARRTPESFVPRFAAGLARLRLAESGGRVRGFSFVTGTHLDMLFVDPAAQGTGAGRALLAEAEARGVASLECFRANHAARRFYERAGWHLVRGYTRSFEGAEHRFVFYEKLQPPKGL
jgi:putative acetyltransferase